MTTCAGFVRYCVIHQVTYCDMNGRFVSTNRIKRIDRVIKGFHVVGRATIGREGEGGRQQRLEIRARTHVFRSHTRTMG